MAGSQLGLSQWVVVDWKGHRGMQWPVLLPLLFNEYAGPRLQMLLIHLGRNYFGLVRGKALVLQVIKDLRIIKARWPWVRIIWSAIIPGSWWNALDPHVMNKAHKNAN